MPRWQQRVAGWVARAVALAAVWSFLAIPLHLVLPGLVKKIDISLQFLGIPAGHTFFSAVYLAVVGSALLRGKRAALLWVLWVFEGLWLLGLTGYIAFSTVRLNSPNSSEWLSDFDRTTVQDLEWSIVQWVVVAALIVLLWMIRGAFPARLAPGTRRLAIGALVLGMMISIAVSITLTQIFPNTLSGQRQKIGWAVIAALGHSRSKMGGHEGHGWIGLLVGGISAASLVIAFWI